MQNKSIRIAFSLLFALSIGVFIIELSGNFFKKANRYFPDGNKKENYDSSLSRLRSITSFVNYCDSLYRSKQIAVSDSEKYAEIISRVLRDRFYHGYSYYGLGDNTLGYLLAPLIKKDLSAIVIPDDILKYPMAACSQQSIVGMEVFKRKGFNVRKVGFNADNYGGHFCYEAFFGGKWHFFDPDMEPKLSTMIANHFPGIIEIVKNDSLLHLLYQKRDSSLVESLFPTYQYGPVNKFPAPHAIIYQYVTKYLSYCLWLVLLLTYFFVYKRSINLKKKRECAESQDSLAPKLRA